MAHPIVDQDILRCTFVVQGLQGQVALPSVHYRVGITTGVPTDVDLASALDTIASVDLLPLMANDATYKGVLVQRIAPLPVQARVQDVSSAGPGTGGATLAPQQCAPIVSMYADGAGPGMRGRFFVPFMPGNVMNNVTGELTILYRASVQNLATGFLGVTTVGSGGNVAAVYLCIFHRKTLTFTDVATVAGQPKVGTQKRRGNYGKPNISPI